MAVESEKRWKSFAKLDTAELGWFHLRSVIVAGTGFFTDAYDIFVISQALPMIYTYYYPDYNVNFKTKYPGGKHLDAWMKASTSWGNLVGQIGFGILADKLGRKKMYGVELIIMIVCTIGSCLAAPMYSLSILVVLSVWRFFLGVGIGGDYPMSAIITSEFANVQSRGFLMASVFAMQGAGILLGGIVYYATLEGMTTLIQADYRSIDIVWRLGLGIGIIPAIIALYFRLTIPETPRYTVDVIGDTNKGTSDVDMVLQLNKVKEISSTWNQDEVAVANTTTKNNS
ncbi:phosphate transporter, partial [Rhizoclosmatium hyalinum]